jgi:hypothetical protein
VETDVAFHGRASAKLSGTCSPDSSIRSAAPLSGARQLHPSRASFCGVTDDVEIIFCMKYVRGHGGLV